MSRYESESAYEREGHAQEVRDAIAAERERCAKLLDERAEELKRIAVAGKEPELPLTHDLLTRANEAGWLASIIRCACVREPLSVPAANHNPACPVFQWWFQNEANIQGGA